jgi:hypothetical protein
MDLAIFFVVISSAALRRTGTFAAARVLSMWKVRSAMEVKQIEIAEGVELST